MLPLSWSRFLVFVSFAFFSCCKFMGLEDGGSYRLRFLIFVSSFFSFAFFFLLQVHGP